MGKKKILFLGLDAAMPDLIQKFVEEGNMPGECNECGQAGQRV